MITQYELGASLQHLRKKRYYTQEMVVALMREKGFSFNRSMLSKCESGFRNVTALELVALAEIYSVSIDMITKQLEFMDQSEGERGNYRDRQ